MPITVPSSPFVEPNGDVVLRSSDHQDFLVIKVILTIASSFFHSMFSLPQPEGQVGRPVIPVTEDSTTIDTLLRLSYPVKKPVVSNVQIAEAVLAAAVKYEMGVVVQDMCRVLVSQNYLDTEPLRIYAIACRYKLVEEARLAAKATLRVLIEDIYLDEFETLPTSCYFHLLKYRRRVAVEICDVLSRSCSSSVPEADADANALACTCPGERLSGRPYAKPSCHGNWWRSFVSRALAVVGAVPHSPTIFSQEFLRVFACGE